MYAERFRQGRRWSVVASLTLLVSFLEPSRSAAESAAAGVSITNAIAINKRSDLDFGSIVVSETAAGTVSLTPSGARSSSGNISFGSGTPAIAAFAVTRSSKNDTHFSVALPSSVVVTNEMASMIVDHFEQNAQQDPRSAVSVLMVGATLNLAVNQAPGYYMGTFTVTVDEH